MDQAAQAAQANSLDPSSSQIQVEHDRKRRQFVIRLNGERSCGCEGVPLCQSSEVFLQLGGRSHSSLNKDLYQCLSTLFHHPGSHDRAVLLYEYVGKKTVDLQHTEVPDAYRGRGIAKHLAKAAMDFVVEEDLKAHLTCWYIQKYVKENPQPQYFEHIYQ